MPHTKASAAAHTGLNMLSIEHASSKPLKDGIALWQRLCAGRRYPSRQDITLRTLGRLAPHTVLIKVLDGGRDYEYRIVGDVPVSTTGHNFQGKRLSDPEVNKIMHKTHCREQYLSVLGSGEAHVFKAWMHNHRHSNLPSYTEAVFMPLSDDGETIDHLFGIIVFTEEKPTADK